VVIQLRDWDTKFPNVVHRQENIKKRGPLHYALAKRHSEHSTLWQGRVADIGRQPHCHSEERASSVWGSMGLRLGRFAHSF
jgi:hypothetical protein